MDDTWDQAKWDEHFMKQALLQAQRADEEDEVPVGAVVVCENMIIAKAYNQTERLKDATAHAEMLAITSAANYLNSKYLNDCTLYVTLEPCLMCGTASHWSQLGRLVYGATDLKKGFQNFSDPVLHTKTKISSGVLEQECAVILSNFFARKRL